MKHAALRAVLVGFVACSGAVPPAVPRSADVLPTFATRLMVSESIFDLGALYGTVQVAASDGAPQGPGSAAYAFDDAARSARVGAWAEVAVVLPAAGRSTLSTEDGDTLWHVHEAAVAPPAADLWTPAAPAVAVWSLGDAVVVQTSDALLLDRGLAGRSPLLELGDGLVAVAPCGPATDPAARVAVVANGALHLFLRTPSGRYARAAMRAVGDAVAASLDVADLDGDGQREVVVLWVGATEGSDTFEAWSPGASGWTLVERFDVVGGGLAGAGVFARRDGAEAVLEVFPSGGGWRRWQRTAQGVWREAVELPQLEVPAGTTVVGGLPLLGSAARDLVLVGPSEPLTGERVVRFLDLDRSPASVIEVRSAGAAWAISPSSGAVAEALWTREPDGTARVFAAGLTGPTQWSLSVPAGAGPLVGVVGVGDAAPDLWSDDGQGWSWSAGADVGAAAPWARATAPIVPLADGVSWFDVEPTRADGPTLSALVATGEAAAGFTVRRYTVDAPGASTVDRARVALPVTLGAFVDAALCDGVLWWLGEGGLQAVVAGSNLRLGVADAASAGAVDVACDGGRVAVVGASGGRLLDATGALIASSTTAGNGVALVPGAAPGADWDTAVVTCQGSGCVAGTWPDRDVPAIFTTEVDGTLGWGEPDGRQGRLPLAGASALRDMDGDGRLDWTVLAADGRVALVRRTPQGPGAIEAWRLPRPARGTVAPVDLDRDGRLDWLTLSAEGLWYVTALSGGAVPQAPDDTAAADTAVASP